MSLWNYPCDDVSIKVRFMWGINGQVMSLYLISSNQFSSNLSGKAEEDDEKLGGSEEGSLELCHYRKVRRSPG